MTKPLNCLSCLLVLLLTLFCQVSLAFDIDNSKVAIEKVSDSWFVSGDINDDIDGMVGSVFFVPDNIEYCLSIVTVQIPFYSELCLKPEARAPPKV